MTVESWTVFWTDSRGQRRMIDVGNQNEAMRLGILLAESGRAVVAIDGSECEMTAEETQRMNETKERIRRRIAVLPVEELMREAAG
jgi:ABC-type uncharacterized transport system ATPase subunit